MRNAKRVAHALGWFSLALGAVEIAAPKKVTDALDVTRRNGLVRTFGAREIAAGIGILTRNRKGPWMWGRVAGDALDLAALGAALKSRRRRAAVGVALASVAAITALDVIVGRKLSKRRVFAQAGRDARPPNAKRRTTCAAWCVAGENAPLLRGGVALDGAGEP